MKTKTGIKLNFGDVIINHWAGERNPHRKGIVLWVTKHVRCCSPDGKMWDLCNDKHTEITVIGNCFNKAEFGALTFDYSKSDEITTIHHRDNPIF